MDMIKSGIISSEEKILWQGKVGKIGINSRKIRMILYSSFGVFIIILMMIFMMINLKVLENPFTIIFINCIASIFMMCAFYHRLLTSEIINIVYYITDKKVFDRNKGKDNNDGYYQYQMLNFEAMDKIIIHPSKILKRKVAHIDFYSKSMRENKENNIFRIKNDIPHRESIDLWRTRSSFEKFRFYYVEDYETLKAVLLKLVPEKIQIS